MEKAVNDLEVSFEMTVEKMKMMVEDMVNQMNKGLQKEEENHRGMKMLISCFDTSRISSLRSCPNSSQGPRNIYALDLGGTNARAFCVKLGQKQVMEGGYLDLEVGDSVVEEVPLRYKTGTLEDLFSFLSGIIQKLIEREKPTAEKERELEREKSTAEKDRELDREKSTAEKDRELDREKSTAEKDRELGFCFSFPTTNMAINAAKLTNWTKDYNIKYEQNIDLVQALREALRNSDKDLKINVRALVNDTVGTLAIGHLHDDNCMAGVIFGTGTNAAYIEDLEKISKGKDLLGDSKKMVINMEWGNYNPPGGFMTKYDHLVDNATQNKKKQIFEKMISGQYLGEIVGRILLELAIEVKLFGGKDFKTQENKFIKLGTKVVKKMHNDPYLAGEVFEVGNLSRKQSKIVAKVCKLVVKRAARLSATGIVAILAQLGKVTVEEKDDRHKPVIIAIDGTLYEKYGKFRKYLKDGLDDLLGENFNKIVTLKEVKDGSSLGTAIIAACYSS